MYVHLVNQKRSLLTGPFTIHYAIRIVVTFFLFSPGRPWKLCPEVRRLLSPGRPWKLCPEVRRLLPPGRPWKLCPEVRRFWWKGCRNPPPSSTDTTDNTSLNLERVLWSVVQPLGCACAGAILLHGFITAEDLKIVRRCKTILHSAGDNLILRN